ncbi:baseplate J/gp47 family protein [Streptomyces sp. ODS28]|uniref:baseplate J/gp47 family protein n=1 Tax=Streptomyces sp. ODS28 TaxID=3136688 RepID=UPI0031F0F3C3
MAEIKRTDGRPVIDYMARDYDSLLRAMRDLVPQKLPEWRDFANEADFGNVLLELFAHLGDILSYYQDRVANESFLGTARTRGSVIQHLRLIGYELGTAAPAAATLSLTVPAEVNSAVTIARGDAFTTASGRGRPSVRFEYTQDTPLTVDFGALPVVGGVRVFGPPQGGVPVEEGRLFPNELLGVSDGRPDQRFPLVHPGLILRPAGSADQTGQPGGRDVRLTTTLGATVAEWKLRDTLAFSQAGQRDFTVEIDADDRATVVFGDGGFGAIPDRGAQIRASYRTGGGAAGNVPAGAVTTLVGATPLALLSAKVTNHAPATGGADRESGERAVRNAPAVFRSQHRAVTTADYEALARSFKGVGKVRADAGGWNQVTLYVAPDGGGKVSDVLESRLLAFFEDRRMLGQIVEIADVDYVPLLVTAQLAVESFFAVDDVLAAVRAAARALLAFDRVDFRQTVYLSKFYEVIQDVPGVVFVNVTEFRRGDSAGPPVDPQGRITFGPNEIPVLPPAPDPHADGLRIELVSQEGK